MESIVNSQLTGKWYKITRTPQSRELKFMEIFIYLSTNYKNVFDLLYVGVKDDRSKILRKISLKISMKQKTCHLTAKGIFFKKRFKVLLFDEENGLLILSDRGMKNVSIYSKKYKISHETLEYCLNKIKFPNDIKLIINEMNLQ